jgi:5-oxoprolinase (ATP-hydrolysing) subunit A
MSRIDLNCDLGESFGAYTIGRDEDVLPSVTSANIACGFHAGDPATMRVTVRAAEARGVGIGAHPGFPDLRGFGRRVMQVPAADVHDDVVYQIGALAAFTKTKRLQHVKAHGALYNMAVDGGDYARAVTHAVLDVDPAMILIVLAGSPWERVARDAGALVAREVFADRAVHADGTLVSRATPGAVIHDRSAVIERSLRLVTEGTVTAITGEIVSLEADTICVHGDTPGAASLAAGLRDAFERAGVALVPLSRVLAR